MPDLEAAQRLLADHPENSHLPAEVLAERLQDARGGIFEAIGLKQYAIYCVLDREVLAARVLVPPPLRQSVGEPPARVEETLEAFPCLRGLVAGVTLAGPRLLQFPF